MSPAVIAGSGASVFAVALAISAVTTALQVLVALGRHEAHWPLIGAATNAGRIAAIALHASFTLFFLIGLILALSS